jgi:hypothetical protein
MLIQRMVVSTCSCNCNNNYCSCKGRFIRNYTVVPKYCRTTIFESGRLFFCIIQTPQNVNIRIFIVTYVVVSYEETEVGASQLFSSMKPYDTE